MAGKVACELTQRTYGAAEWWVLVEKDVEAGPSGAVVRVAGMAVVAARRPRLNAEDS